MELFNYNLSTKEFEVIRSFLVAFSPEGHLSTGSGKLLFIRIPNMLQDSRWLLRRATNQHPDAQLVLLSLNVQVAALAWRIGAFHFISFPLSKAQLKMLLNKVVRANRPQQKRQLKMSYQGGFDLIALSDIILIKGKGDYVEIYLRQGKMRTYTYRISKLAAQLTNWPGFERLNKSILINIQAISKVKPDCVILRAEQTVALQLGAESRKLLLEKLLWIDPR